MSSPDQNARDSAGHSELLLLPDGHLLVHNLTPMLADFLKEFAPADPALVQRTDSCRTTGEVQSGQLLDTEH